MNLSNKSVLAAAGLLLFLFVVGSSFVSYRNQRRFITPTQPSDSNVSFAANAGTVLAESSQVDEHGNRVKVEGRLIEGFPQVPQFPGAEIENSFREEVSGNAHFESVSVAGSPLIDVRTFFLSALQNAGWTHIPNGMPPEASELGLEFKKGNQYVSYLIEREDEDETEIVTYVWSENQ